MRGIREVGCTTRVVAGMLVDMPDSSTLGMGLYQGSFWSVKLALHTLH